MIENSEGNSILWLFEVTKKKFRIGTGTVIVPVALLIFLLNSWYCTSSRLYMQDPALIQFFC